MAKLTTIKGDATKPIQKSGVAIVIPHVVNDIGRWGSGFVNAITARFGEGVRSHYLAWANGDNRGSAKQIAVSKEHGTIVNDEVSFSLGGLQLVQVPDNNIFIANMVGQHKVAGMDESGRPPIRYAALACAMRSMQCHMSLMDSKFKGAEIHCPKFGSDLAGGEWKVIEALIQEIWVDRGIPVIVYEFDG